MMDILRRAGRLDYFRHQRIETITPTFSMGGGVYCWRVPLSFDHSGVPFLVSCDILQAWCIFKSECSILLASTRYRDRISKLTFIILIFVIKEQYFFDTGGSETFWSGSHFYFDADPYKKFTTFNLMGKFWVALKIQIQFSTFKSS